MNNTNNTILLAFTIKFLSGKDRERGIKDYVKTYKKLRVEL